MAAVALVNSAVGPDTMTSLAELDAFLHRHAYTNTSAHDAAALAAVRALRMPLRTLLTSERDPAAEIVNRILVEHTAVPPWCGAPSPVRSAVASARRPCAAGSPRSKTGQQGGRRRPLRLGPPTDQALR